MVIMKQALVRQQKQENANYAEDMLVKAVIFF